MEAFIKVNLMGTNFMDKENIFIKREIRSIKERGSIIKNQD